MQLARKGGKEGQAGNFVWMLAPGGGAMHGPFLLAPGDSSEIGANKMVGVGVSEME